MTTPTVALNEYRLALVQPHRHHLLALADGRTVRLPRVTIPVHRRLAEELTTTVKERWGFDSIVLDVLTDGSPAAPCAVLEIRSRPTCNIGEGFLITDSEAIDPADLTKNEQEALKGLLSETGHQERSWSGIRWLDDVIAWIESVLAGTGLKLNGRFRQLNGGRAFSLIRFETSGSAIWFKSVGVPNLREFPVSVALARLFPTYVPSLLATNPVWSAWLTVEAEGSPLDGTSEFSSWLDVSRMLGKLQVESRPTTAELLQAGCRDARITALSERIDPFLEIMAELMERQLKIPPRVLNRQELRLLGIHINDACNRLVQLGSADTLGHFDFNPGNVLVSSARCIFLDWAEAYVGHPFFTFEYLLQHFRRVHPAQTLLEKKLESTYLDCWRTIASAEELREVITLIPLVATFAYAVAADIWKDALRPEYAKVAGYLRALTRGMHHQAAVLAERRRECLS